MTSANGKDVHIMVCKMHCMWRMQNIANIGTDRWVPTRCCDIPFHVVLHLIPSGVSVLSAFGARGRQRSAQPASTASATDTSQLLTISTTHAMPQA